MQWTNFITKLKTKRGIKIQLVRYQHMVSFLSDEQCKRIKRTSPNYQKVHTQQKEQQTKTYQCYMSVCKLHQLQCLTLELTGHTDETFS